MVAMVTKMKFSVNKYSHVFNRFCAGYEGLAKLIIIDQYVGFPGEEYSFSFTDVEFHIVSSAPTLYRVNCSLKYIAVLRRVDGSVNFEIVSKN
jgi:hypothetical protein